MVYADDEQVYGLLTAALGSRFFDVSCLDGRSRRCRVRNRRMRVTKGEWCIISLRPFDDNAGDIIYRYKPEEVRVLKKQGAIPSDFDAEVKGTIQEVADEEIAFDFEDI